MIALDALRIVWTHTEQITQACCQLHIYFFRRFSHQSESQHFFSLRRKQAAYVLAAAKQRAFNVINVVASALAFVVVAGLCYVARGSCTTSECLVLYTRKSTGRYRFFPRAPLFFPLHLETFFFSKSPTCRERRNYCQQQASPKEPSPAIKTKNVADEEASSGLRVESYVQSNSLD